MAVGALHTALGGLLSAPAYCVARLSRTSCWRNGILSMTRESSRTLHGKGLRSFTPPSLPISTIINPRGRNLVRKTPSADGSVSVSTMTSRSVRSSGNAFSNSSCWMYRGSFGLSAKIKIGRLSQRYVSSSAEAPSKINVSSGVASSVFATTEWPINIGKTRAKQNRFMFPIDLNIGRIWPNAMGSMAAFTKKLTFDPFAVFGGPESVTERTT